MTTTPTPAPQMACPCTTFEQDEDCPVGFPSLLCSACAGTGIAPAEKVVALAAEMMKVAEQVDELEDPLAAWESISLIQSQNSQMRRALNKISDLVDDENSGFDEAIDIADAALTSAGGHAPAPHLPSVDEIDAIIERLLDAQQDINLAANETMRQALCDASALIDELEKLLMRVKSAAPAASPTETVEMMGSKEGSP